MKLGVDLGNVIIDHLTFGTTREFFLHGNYNDIPPVPNAIEVMANLNRNLFFGETYVVYNATDVADSKIRSWLEFNFFFERTGIRKENVVRSDGGRNKSSFCIKNKITHFVDDRLEVLANINKAVPHLYLMRAQKREVESFSKYLDQVTIVDGWTDLLKKIH